jgi:hypothetical protein
MAGETAIVYETPVPERELPAMVATTWLLAVWIAAAAVAASGLTWAILTRPSPLSGVVVHAFGAMYGGPLYLLSWVWLAGIVEFRHRPFLVLAGLWLVVWVPPVQNAITDSIPATLVILGGLPVVSCIAVLALVLRIRSRQAAYFESHWGLHTNARR